MVPEVANLGIVRPPFVYMCAIALGLLLDFAWPVRLAPGAVSLPLGGSAGRRRSVHVSNRWHARSGQSPYHHDRAHRALSLDPQSHLSVILAIPSRSRIVGQ